MNLDKTIMAILLVPFLGLSIPAALFFRKLPPPALKPVEKELISFASQPVIVTQPGQLAVYTGLECPVRPPAVKVAAVNKGAANFPPGPIPLVNSAVLQKSKPVITEYTPGVSMIYSDGQSRMAIIDGHVMHEGAAIGSSKVLKIEKTKVLLRTTGKDIWLNVDGQ